MKFILDAGKMIEVKPILGNAIMDGWNHLSDKVIGAEVEMILKPIGLFLQESLIQFGHWFIVNLPDIMGYGAMLAGICIILGGMFGKGGMMKPLAIYAGMLILALCILGGV